MAPAVVLVPASEVRRNSKAVDGGGARGSWGKSRLVSRSRSRDGHEDRVDLQVSNRFQEQHFSGRDSRERGKISNRRASEEIDDGDEKLIQRKDDNSQKSGRDDSRDASRSPSLIYCDNDSPDRSRGEQAGKVEQNKVPSRGRVLQRLSGHGKQSSKVEQYPNRQEVARSDHERRSRQSSPRDSSVESSMQRESNRTQYQSSDKISAREDAGKHGKYGDTSKAAIDAAAAAVAAAEAVAGIKAAAVAAEAEATAKALARSAAAAVDGASGRRSRDRRHGRDDVKHGQDRDLSRNASNRHHDSQRDSQKNDRNRDRDSHRERDPRQGRGQDTHKDSQRHDRSRDFQGDRDRHRDREPQRDPQRRDRDRELHRDPQRHDRDRESQRNAGDNRDREPPRDSHRQDRDRDARRDATGSRNQDSHRDTHRDDRRQEIQRDGERRRDQHTHKDSQRHERDRDSNQDAGSHRDRASHQDSSRNDRDYQRHDRDRDGRIPRGDAMQSHNQASDSKRKHPDDDRRREHDSDPKVSRSRSELQRKVQDSQEEESKTKTAEQKGGKIKTNWVWVPAVPEKATTLEFFQSLSDGVVAANFEGAACVIETSGPEVAEGLIKSLLADEIYACTMQAPPGSKSNIVLVKQLSEEADSHRYFKALSSKVKRADIAVSTEEGRFCIIDSEDNASAKELIGVLKEKGMVAELITPKSKDNLLKKSKVERAKPQRGRTRSRSRSHRRARSDRRRTDRRPPDRREADRRPPERRRRSPSKGRGKGDKDDKGRRDPPKGRTRSRSWTLTRPS
eukprot:gnl/MRDRNA2_/MRDRNA2_110168_c0_seq1.p1 gnl/MRDRNA2_/MRDRNA2_110168_c0~~gnl/MRDRNA2_/MRDRNA2_110168_c0_seq1.p1  ORF type:complete len:810 (+),score=140.16 gnl/MRDRNA2_/MRDRNA2_110168_c0_seq1:59-2431(+)